VSDDTTKRITDLEDECTRLRERCDRIANVATDAVVAVLANYETIRSEFGVEESVADVIHRIDNHIDADLQKIGCPAEEVRRERFRRLLLSIQCEKTTKAEARIAELESALRALLNACEFLRVGGSAVEGARKALEEKR